MANWKKRTVDEGKAIVTQLEKSGLSQLKFADKIGISVAVVRYWAAKLRKEKKRLQKESPVRFLEVLPALAPARQMSSIELPGGIVLKTQELPSPEYIGELYAELQRWRSC